MKKNFLRIMSIFVVLHPYILLAQHFIPQDVPTPNVSNLGHYEDVSVSNYTGAANVSIPLYNTEIHGIPFNISLNYDTSGVLLNTLPAWTGHNWNLCIGGYITRIANGREDEYIIPQDAHLPYSCQNYFQSYPYLRIPSIDTAISSIKNAYVDLSPDVFIFNFMGHTGKFFLGHNGEWLVSSDENIDVIFDYNDPSNFIYPFIKDFPSSVATEKQPKTIKGFTLKTGDGTVFKFGGSEDSIEYTTDFFHMGDQENVESWKANIWHLTEVIDKYGQTIYTFMYQRGKFLTQVHNSLEITSVYERGHWNWGACSSFGHTLGMSNSTFPFQITLNSPVYLTSIDMANGVHVGLYSNDIKTDSLNWHETYRKMYDYNALVYLASQNCMKYTRYQYTYLQNPKYKKYQGTSDNQMNDPITVCRLRQLDKISISAPVDSKNEIEFKFNYSFKNRMHLTSISLHNIKIHYDVPNSLIGKYSFIYDNMNALPSDYLTTSIDHWGYYNGNKTSSYVTSIENFENYKTCREPSSNFTKYGMLNDIVYPTGGVTSIEYESNDFSSYASLDKKTLVDSCSVGGGLRVSRITQYDDITKQKILGYKEYEYKIPGTEKSSGQLYSKPKYHWIYNRYDSKGNINIEGSYSTFRTSSIAPLSNSFGPALGYSFVKEKKFILDSISQRPIIENSTVYNYTNLSDYQDEPIAFSINYSEPSPYDRFADLSYKRGKIKEMTTYDALGNKISKTKYEYWSKYSFANTHNIEYHTYGNSAAFTFWTGCIYKLYADQFLVKKEIDSLFTKNGNIETIKTVEWKKFRKQHVGESNYNPGIYLPVSEKLERKNISTTTTFTYAFNSDWQYLASNMFVLKPISISSFWNEKLISTSSTTYDWLDKNKQYLIPRLEVERNAFGISDTIVQYKNYSQTGALLSYKKKGETEKRLTWGYNDCYLLAISEASSYPFSQLILPYEHTEFSTLDHEKVELYFAEMRKIYGQAIYAVNYSYHPLYGVTSITQPNGNTTYYDYDILHFKLNKISDFRRKPVKFFEYQYRK